MENQYVYIMGKSRTNYEWQRSIAIMFKYQRVWFSTLFNLAFVDNNETCTDIHEGLTIVIDHVWGVDFDMVMNGTHISHLGFSFGHVSEWYMYKTNNEHVVENTPDNGDTVQSVQWRHDTHSLTDVWCVSRCFTASSSLKSTMETQKIGLEATSSTSYCLGYTLKKWSFYSDHQHGISWFWDLRYSY